MKKTILLVLFIFATTFPYGNNERGIRMRKIRDERIDFQYKRCYYGGKGFKISIVAEYNCPYSILYYPISNTWKLP